MSATWGVCPSQQKTLCEPSTLCLARSCCAVSRSPAKAMKYDRTDRPCHDPWITSPPPPICSCSIPPPSLSLSGVNYSATTTAGGGGGGGKVHWKSFLECSAEDRTIDHPHLSTPSSPQRSLWANSVQQWSSQRLRPAGVNYGSTGGPATHQGQYWLLLRWNTHAD